MAQRHGPFQIAPDQVVDVHLQLACLDPQTYSRPNAEHWLIVPAQSHGSDCGTRLIRDFVISFGGQEYRPAVSAFSDLLSGDGFDAEVAGNDTGAVVTVSGGAGALGRWTARLQFEDGVLVERYVTSSTFRDEAFERTVYGQPQDN